MYVLINHLDTIGVDLSLTVSGTFRQARLLPAGVTSGAFTVPTMAYVGQAHLDAINALPADDRRRSGYEVLDMGDVGPDGRYATDKQAALAAAMAPRKTVIVVGTCGYGR